MKIKVIYTCKEMELNNQLGIIFSHSNFVNCLWQTNSYHNADFNPWSPDGSFMVQKTNIPSPFLVFQGLSIVSLFVIQPTIFFSFYNTVMPFSLCNVHSGGFKGGTWSCAPPRIWICVCAYMYKCWYICTVCVYMLHTYMIILNPPPPPPHMKDF